MTSSTESEAVMPDLKNKASRWTLLGFTAFVDRRAHKGYLCCTEYPVKKNPDRLVGVFLSVVATSHHGLVWIRKATLNT